MAQPTQPDPPDTRPPNLASAREQELRTARKADSRTLGMALAISMIAGVVVGAAMDNVGLWIAIAVGVGVAVGVAMNQKRNAARKPK